MAEQNDDIIARGDLAAALGLLSRLPVPVDPAQAAARGGRAAWAWPLAGLVLAGLAGSAGSAALALGLAPAISAGIVLAVLLLTTGAMHEDGLADSADGLWGGWDRSRRLEIMKDSRVGTYGVVALILSLGLRWAAISALCGAGALLPGLIAAALASRAAMAALMGWLPPARDGGLSRQVGAPPARAVWIGSGIAAAGLILTLGTGAIAATLAAGIVTLVWGQIAKSRIGGQTGDILGAGQQLTEIAVLCAAAAILS